MIYTLHLHEECLDSAFLREAQFSVRSVATAQPQSCSAQSKLVRRSNSECFSLGMLCTRDAIADT